jgi:hypothetical protein
MRPSLALSFWVVISEWGNSCGFSSHPVDPPAPNHVTFHFFFNSRRPGLTNHPYMVILTCDTPLWDTQKNVTLGYRNPSVHRAPTEYDQFYRLLMSVRRVDTREFFYIS